MAAPRVDPRRVRGGLGDLAFLALLAVFWVRYVTPIVIEERLRGYDIFRDVAYAVNVQHGRLLADPAYVGETIWYPPLSPAIVAGLASWLNVTPTDCYVWSQLVFNWTLPVGLFLIVRLHWGRRAAMAATVAFLLATPWWQCEVAHGQPSVHSVVWGLAAVLLYGLQHRRASTAWACGCGLLLGLAFWHHPFIPAALAVVFVVQTVWACGRARAHPDRVSVVRGLVRRNVLILAIALALAAPILYLMLHGPTLNHEPREYIASELRTVEFALMRGNVWIWGMGLIGLVSAIRRADWGCRVLIAALGVSVVGQLPGYARLFELGLPATIPTLVPHEFQRLFQLGWAVCVGVGINATLTVLAMWDRLSSRSAVSLLTLLSLVVTGAWGLGDTKENLRRFLLDTSLPPAFHNTIDWIVDHTDINDVFACEPAWAFGWLNAETGRKVWIGARGHSNPRIDWLARQEVLLSLLETSSPRTFWRIATGAGIDYFVPSPSWNPKVLREPAPSDGPAPAYFTLVHGGPDAVPVFRINQTPR